MAPREVGRGCIRAPSGACSYAVVVVAPTADETAPRLVVDPLVLRTGDRIRVYKGGQVGGDRRGEVVLSEGFRDERRASHPREELACVVRVACSADVILGRRPEGLRGA